MRRYSIAIFVMLMIMQGCSFRKLVVNSVSGSGILNYGVEALYDETDLQLAEQATGSNLKLLEGLHLSNPRNKDLLLLLTQGYASYSLGFIEDVSMGRAKMFYLRARDYGLERLRLTNAFKDSIPTKEEEFISRLQKLTGKDTPVLFWTGFAWGGWINLSKDDPQAIFDLGKVKAIMNRVLELDETYFYGAAYLFFGSIYGSLPRMLGGDPEKAKEQFERCLAISDNKFMLAYVYLARYYAQPMLDEALFDRYLKIVLQASPDILPENRMLTAIAKDKAQKLIIKKEELF